VYGRPLPLVSDNHLSRPYITAQLQRPTCTLPGLGMTVILSALLTVLLRMGFTRKEVTSFPRGLLHHGSTLTCAYKYAIGGTFLWHYPSARADWMLSSTLPYGARTFLSCLYKETVQNTEAVLSSLYIESTSDCQSSFPTSYYTPYSILNQREKRSSVTRFEMAPYCTSTPELPFCNDFYPTRPVNNR